MIAIALQGPSRWLMAKMRDRQRVAVFVRSSAGMNQSMTLSSRSLKSLNIARPREKACCGHATAAWRTAGSSPRPARYRS